VNTLYIAGIGTGNPDNMTAACKNRLLEADMIIGYSGYINLLRPHFPDKVFEATGMTEEAERCGKAIKLAREGKNVCLVSSGDAGIYGMASLVFELLADVPDIKIEVIPGVTSAVNGAALLGAPLSGDFAVISLSDLLTPWGKIEKRLRQAALGDFVICIYNPGSRARAKHLARACDILLEAIPPGRVCGIARHIGQDGQAISVLTLKDLREHKTDMSETIFIGNSQTREIDNRMVTPRGYVYD